MKNETIKNLLNTANNSLRDLHDVLGMDFCAPYGVAYMRGPYTVNKAIKTATANGYTAGDLLVILTRDAGKTCYRNDLSLVTVEQGGKINIDHRPPYRAKGIGLDYFYAKGCFEDVRKSEKAESFILWQRREYLKASGKKPLDKTARYKVLETRYCYYYDVKRKYIDRLTLEQIGEKGTKQDYKIERYSWRNGERTPADVADVIDKSGYFVQDRREDLERRAAALKAQREKAAFDASDNADKVQELEKRITARKAELVRQLSAATTSEEISAVSKALASWGGLSDAVEDFERFRERVEKKSFESVTACEKAYKNILGKIAKEA